ncbi:MAG: hypothetical protein RL189_1617 [Pseudomonadota bacterium]
MSIASKTAEHSRPESHRVNRTRWIAADMMARVIALPDSQLAFVNFASAAESSTQQALAHLDLAIIVAAEKASEVNCGQLSDCLLRVHEWLFQWAADEDNHIHFFALVRDKFSAQASFSMSAGSIGVEAPIPEQQSWDTTLLFLLYSEIASMIWYRDWYRRTDDCGMRAALKEIHRDEAEHFRIFLNFCCEISSLSADFKGEARRVLSSFAFHFKRMVSGRAVSPGHGLQSDGHINWWEHAIFLDMGDVLNVLRQIHDLQRFSCKRISKAGKEAMR